MGEHRTHDGSRHHARWRSHEGDILEPPRDKAPPLRPAPPSLARSSVWMHNIVPSHRPRDVLETSMNKSERPVKRASPGPSPATCAPTKPTRSRRAATPCTPSAFVSESGAYSAGRGAGSATACSDDLSLFSFYRAFVFGDEYRMRRQCAKRENALPISCRHRSHPTMHFSFIRQAAPLQSEQGHHEPLCSHTRIPPSAIRFMFRFPSRITQVSTKPSCCPSFSLSEPCRHMPMVEASGRGCNQATYRPCRRG